MSELLNIAAVWSGSRPENRKGALATVIGTHGSTFRRPGARMLIFEDGKTVGSVSGGCLESSIIEAASEVIRSGKSMTLRYDGARDDVILGEGAMCDGEVAICVESIEQELSDDLLAIADKEQESDLLIQVFDDGQRGATTRIGSGRKSDADDRTILFQERVQPPLKILLCGAGALADAVGCLAGTMGWEPLIVDHRPHFLSAMHGRVRRIDDGSGLAELIDQPARTAVVVMTHHFERDLSLLEIAVSLEPLYVGLLGSRGRSARLMAELQERQPDLNLSRLHAPVGLDIGSETIEEIALSIVAEIQAVRRSTRGGHLREGTTPVHGRGSARMAAVLLSAGGSRRMGEPKLLLEGASGKPMISEIIENLIALDLNDLLVVEGAEQKVGEIARDIGVRTIRNEEWHQGVGGSIRLAVDAVGEDIDAVLVVLGDQPRIRRTDLENLITAWRESRAPVIATAYPEGGGVPAVFERSLFDELRRIDGDRGARDLIRSLAGVKLVRLDDTRDVDDPASYASVIGGDSTD